MGVSLGVIMARDSEAAELAYQLRGGPAFDALQTQEGIKIWTAEPGSDRAPMPRDRRMVAFVDLSLIIDYPDRWTALVDLGCPIILDVHFPFGLETQILAIQPGRNMKTRDQRVDAQAQARWSDPGRLMMARAMIYEATVVTCPRKEWAQLLDDFDIEIDVRVLPDVVSPESGYAYAVALLDAVNRAMRLQLSADLSRWQRFILATLEGFSISRAARRVMATRVEAVLRASDIDWEARKDGKG